MRNPFRYFKNSPDIIRLSVMMYIRFPLSLRQVEDLLHERGIEISYETVRAWWNRFGPMFAAEIRNKRSASIRAQIQSGDENGRWRNSEAPPRYKKSLPFMLQFITTSTKNAPSTAARISSSIAPPPSPSGANFLWPEVSRMAHFFSDTHSL